MQMFVLSIFSFLYFVQNGSGFAYDIGNCPKIKSVEHFNMTKFLGVWYGIEANDNSLSCTKFTFKATNYTLKFTIEESSNLRYLKFVQYYFSRSGKVKVISSDVPASMKVKWHWSSPSEDMIVFDSDYHNYAGVFFCSKALIASQTRIFILSRHQNLTKEHTEKVKESLRLNRYRSKGMSKIKHEDCPNKSSENTLKITIKQDTLSPKSVARDFEKVLKDNFEKKDCSDEVDDATTTE